MPVNGNGTDSTNGTGGNGSWREDTGPIEPDDIFKNDHPAAYDAQTWEPISGTGAEPSSDDDEAVNASKSRDQPVTADSKKPSLAKQYWWAMALAGAIAFVIGGMGYYLGEDFGEKWRTLTFAAICGTSAVLLVYVGFYQEDNRRILFPPRLKHNIYKKRADRDFWVLTALEHTVEFWVRRHWIDGLILIGNGCLLLGFSLWTLTHFSGAVELATGDAHLQPGTWLITAMIIGFGIPWSLFCFKEPPLHTRDNKEEQKRKRFPVIRLGRLKISATVYLPALLSLPFIVLWWWLRWPIVGWMVHRIIEDPYRIAWLGVVGSLVWISARWSYYLGSFIGVTNREYWIGSTGYGLGGNQKDSMERDRLTTSSVRDPRIGRLLGYGKTITDSESQLDTAFHDQRVPRLEIFQQFLGRPQAE